MGAAAIHRWHSQAHLPGAVDVWLVGTWDAAEFSVVREAVDAQRSCPTVATLREAIAQVERGQLPPEAVLVALPRPGVDWLSEIDRWHTLAPLARLVVVAGAWCEGELRSSRPPAGVVRIYWHELPAWWRQASRRRRAGLAPLWSAPPFARHFEYAASTLGRAQIQAVDEMPTIAVSARDYSVFEALSDALRPSGYRCTWMRRGQRLPAQIAAAIWDGGQLNDAEQAALEEFCREFSALPAPVVVLVDFPRAEHFDALRKTGAAALLAKPYGVDALLGQLDQLAGAATSTLR
jgi:hypothetical protein